MKNPNGLSIEEKEVMAEQLEEQNEAWLRRKSAPKKWFVMLVNSVHGTPIPLVTLEDDVALFDTQDDAGRAGSNNPLGEAFGFEIYEWGSR